MSGNLAYLKSSRRFGSNIFLLRSALFWLGCSTVAVNSLSQTARVYLFCCWLVRTRTRDLFLIREVETLLVRPALCDDPAYFLRFWGRQRFRFPAPFGSVRTRLLHGCCTTSVPAYLAGLEFGSAERHTLERLKRTRGHLWSKAPSKSSGKSPLARQRRCQSLLWSEGPLKS